VGTVRLFVEQAKRLARRLPASAPAPIQATLVTADMAAPVLRQLAQSLNEIENVYLNVCVVQNRFFGGDIRVAGLLTAQDVGEQLRAFPDCRQTIYLPTICLRDGALFLDDATVDDVRQDTARDIRVVDPTPNALAAALGLIRPPRPTGRASSRITEASTTNR
jgi:NifB/MoaA-like Fe-S oxidoreductase